MTPQEPGLESLAEAELRRAYSGTMASDDVPRVVATALAYGRTHPRKLRRTGNPVGYLYSRGLADTQVDDHGFWTANTDAGAAGIEPALPETLERMPSDQAAAIWLVKGCGWTNVQTAEALGVGPSIVADHVSNGVEHLQRALGSEQALIDNQLRALADHRVALVPALVVEAPTPAEPQPESQPAAPAWIRKTLLIALAVLAVVAGTVATVVSLDGGEDATTSNTTDGASSMGRRQVIERSDWTSELDPDGSAGTFALARVGEDQSTIDVAVSERSTTGFVPSSTFEPLAALIVLETDTLPSIDTIVTWDGVMRDVESWNRDLSLREAIRESAAWVFQDLVSEIGSAPLTELIAATGYGNRQSGGSPSSFWLDGDLRVSAVDQLDFLQRLALGQRPFDTEDQATVLASFPRLDGPDSEVRYKTSAALSDKDPVAWLVGVVDTQEGQWVFAYNVDVPVLEGQPQPVSTQQQLAVVFDLLASAGVVAG